MPSLASPPPLIQTPPSWAFEVVQNSITCSKVLAPYPMTQPWNGWTSPWLANPKYTTPLSRSNAVRWFSRSVLNVTPPDDPVPVPGTHPWMTTGPPNFSAPVAMSSACSPAKRRPSSSPRPPLVRVQLLLLDQAMEGLMTRSSLLCKASRIPGRRTRSPN